MTSPCATCTRRCCHHYVVTVTGYDAWAIARGMRLAPEQFLVALPQRTPNGHGFRLDRSPQTYDIALDKAKARTVEQPCVFWLGLPSGGGRCGIYELRPFVCQTYPAYLSEGGVERREDVLCPSKAWRDGTLQQPVWRRRLLRMRVEYDVYALAVARWNDHVLQTHEPDSIGVLAYFTYLLHFYDGVAKVRADVEPDALASSYDAWGARCLDGTSPLPARQDAPAASSDVMRGIVALAQSFFTSDAAARRPSRSDAPVERCAQP